MSSSSSQSPLASQSSPPFPGTLKRRSTHNYERDAAALAGKTNDEDPKPLGHHNRRASYNAQDAKHSQYNYIMTTQKAAGDEKGFTEAFVPAPFSQNYRRKSFSAEEQKHAQYAYIMTPKDEKKGFSETA